MTLACEDGTQIKTHKVILALSSPLFMEILKTNKHPHPLIYMRGLKTDALVAMVDFLYYGEANVNQECLDVFLGLAEELKLRGLTGSSTEVFSAEEELRNINSVPEKSNKEKKLFGKTTPYNPKPKKISTSNAKTEASQVALVSVEGHQLDEQIKSMMTMTENKAYGQKAYACKVCGKEGLGANIKTHIESNHIESNITHSCDVCGKISRSRNGLRLHKAKEHCRQILLQDQGQLEMPQI